MTPHRPAGRNGKLIFTDHYSLLLTFKIMPKIARRKVQSEKRIIWNTNKPGAWENYRCLTEENDALNKLVEDDIFTASEFSERFEKIMDKVKYQSFGKVSFSDTSEVDKPLRKLYEEREDCIRKENDEKIQAVEKNISELLVKKQRIEYEKKLKALNTLKRTKGKSAAIFDLKDKILGEKKVQQEAVVMENPENEELIFDAEKIKSVSLNYLTNLLKNREPKEEYEKELQVINILHEKRMVEDKEDEDTFSHNDFQELLKNLGKKNKAKYKYILEGGQSFHGCLFRLFKIIWEKERKPSNWENTVAHQLFKGKGKMSKLSNYRFIHTKEEYIIS